MLSQLFTHTLKKLCTGVVGRGLNCCGAVSGCIAEQVVPLCLSVFACVKLPPLPSSILSSSARLCPSINPSTLSEPTPSSLLQSRSGEDASRGMREGEACAIKPQTDSERREGRAARPALSPCCLRALVTGELFHLPSASVLIC